MAMNANETTSTILAAAASITGERPSLYPTRVSPALARFAWSWEDELVRYCPDLLPDLLAYAPRLVGTRGFGPARDRAAERRAERRRAWLAADFAVRVAAPAHLRRAGLDEQAERLATLPAVTRTTSEAARAACDAARAEAIAAGGVDIDSSLGAAAVAALAANVAVIHAIEADRAAGSPRAYEDASYATASAVHAASFGGVDVLRELHPAMRALFEAMLAAA